MLGNGTPFTSMPMSSSSDNEGDQSANRFIPSANAHHIIVSAMLRKGSWSEYQNCSEIRIILIEGSVNKIYLVIFGLKG